LIKTVAGNYPKIGSPTKVPSLRQALARLDEGKITPEELRKIEEQVTQEVIDQQVSAGLDLVTDGAIRWDDAQTYFARGLEGFSINGLLRYFDTNVYYRQPIVEGPVKWTRATSVADYQFAAAYSPKSVKAVVIGPYTLAKLSISRHYKSFKKLVLDLAKALNQEAKALEEAGAPVIQFDEPAILKHPKDFDLFEESCHEVTKGITKAKTALYTYFGALDGLYPHFLDLPFDIIGLDFVQGKRNWDSLKSFPQSKELGFGIVDARNTKLETVEELVEALRRISAFVPLSRLHINPSCGLEFLPRANAYNKLVRMVEGAQRAQEVLG
jgi:5-methyltetrahydropteroyltriglutamate--homocysteine methyltransferase